MRTRRITPGLERLEGRAMLSGDGPPIATPLPTPPPQPTGLHRELIRIGLHLERALGAGDETTDLLLDRLDEGPGDWVGPGDGGGSWR